jgi:hypothetical protein
MTRLRGWHVQKRILPWLALPYVENCHLLPVHVSTHNNVLKIYEGPAYFQKRRLSKNARSFIIK